MTDLPEILPEYTIHPSDKEPFTVKWEEMMGWFIVPKLGEKLQWAMYNFPERKRAEYDLLEVTGKAQVHDINGVEIIAKEYDPMYCNAIGKQNPVERRFVAQLTDTHCRILAESNVDDGIRKYYTFLDGDDFLENWGFGEDNCGHETELAPKGIICRKGSKITCSNIPQALDVIGRYTVAFGDKKFDTVCVMDIEFYNEAVVSEQFLDQNGRTILWRRFNRDDWAVNRYKKKWTELLPENEQITVNGDVYVHWYDCMTDYIL